MDAGAVRSFTRTARARPHVRPAKVFATLWVALLLCLIGYVAINGASALFDLDQTRLVAAAY